MTDFRDTLATKIAATLAHSEMPPATIARRAYAVADAMLLERAEPCWLDSHIFEDRFVPDDASVGLDDRDTVPPHDDPRWELSPRWSPEDLTALQARRAGPGLAKPWPAKADDDRSRHTG